ncbi:hypothetical protein [Parafrankia sp. EUN1f]|uniref:hypothetical protein n=1 Tax=Parafrankia sp. EUN1f TaxID=102897 RepID=UPI0001C4599E|nr:hypothetical protein [Parafrankia sp. EUN1f]EFC86485.1 hypothetical protein FrEUN1fDRAFT_0380 [Parafrankia sp. EUN1f]
MKLEYTNLPDGPDHSEGVEGLADGVKFCALLTRHGDVIVMTGSTESYGGWVYRAALPEGTTFMGAVRLALVEWRNTTRAAVAV